MEGAISKTTIQSMEDVYGITLKEFCELLKKGDTFEEALTRSNKRKRVNDLFEYAGFLGTKKEISYQFELCYDTFARALKLGYSIENSVILSKKHLYNRQEYGHVRALCEKYSKNYKKTRSMLVKGKSIDEIFFEI